VAESSRAELLSGDELAAWHGMLSVHAAVTRELDRRLTEEHHLSVTEFDVLITLFNGEAAGTRMTDLARSIMFSPAGLSHLVTRMERDRLVVRRVDPADRRSIRVRLTAAGQALLDRARRTHNDVIREGFTGPLGPEHLRQLASAWAAIPAESTISATHDPGTIPAAPDRG
jgi:DNA-binding MarR family transcriptional regulator